MEALCPILSTIIYRDKYRQWHVRGFLFPVSIDHSKGLIKMFRDQWLGSPSWRLQAGVPRALALHRSSSLQVAAITWRLPRLYTSLAALPLRQPPPIYSCLVLALVITAYIREILAGPIIGVSCPQCFIVLACTFVTGSRFIRCMLRGRGFQISS